MTYGQGLKAGFIITGIVTLLSPLSQYITATFITPHYFDNFIQYSVSRKVMTLQEAKDYFNLKSYILQGFAGAPIMGVVTTLIVTAFTKKTLKGEN
jgi:hypothetical protein